MHENNDISNIKKVGHDEKVGDPDRVIRMSEDVR